jgi:hypothetical protein
MKKIIFAALVSGIILTVPAAAAEMNPPPQAENAKPKRQVIIKKISGEVGGIANNFIAVDYEQDGKATHEMALTMDKNTRGSQVGLKEIKLSDTVLVTYEETVETKEGQKPRIIKRLAKTVELLRPAKINPETSVLESKE